MDNVKLNNELKTAKKKITAVLGGSFDYIHRGHLAILERALSYDFVHIGLTSDEFVLNNKGKLNRSYDERKEELEKVLGLQKHKVKITKIDDAYGFAVSEPNLDVIVVSSETLENAKKINMLRHSTGLKPLIIDKVPLVYGQDLKKISSTSIAQGTIDKEGKRLKPLLVSVGSENPNKIEGTKIAIKEMLKIDVEVIPKHVPTYTKQPFGEETIELAKHRAIQAFSFSRNLDYSVGIESGIFTLSGHSFDIAVASLYDGEQFYLGTSMGFELHEQILEKVHMGSELGNVIDELAKTKDLGKNEGAISFLSQGRMKRIEMNISAVKCAFIKKISEIVMDKHELL
ncbi:MAG: inosine/xanthosine triphosphatase [Candidatus Micrarchaeota archaeon]|nr:inosine/xanthosine triphosphatase [Candidatus Micrarchaeota archaeon]